MLLRDYADGKDLAKGSDAELAKALDKMRAANKGHPSEAEMQAMRDNSQRKEGDGMYLEDALNDHTQGATHVKYTYHDAQDVKGAVKQTELDTWADKLRDGQDVPLRVGWSSGGDSLAGGQHWQGQHQCAGNQLCPPDAAPS